MSDDADNWPVSFHGSGRGILDYRIDTEPSVEKRDCLVEGVEDDRAESLVLSVYFVDATHGLVIVGITVSHFTRQTVKYSGVDRLAILVLVKGEHQGWTSGPTSSVELTVKVTESDGARNYGGNFDAANLTWSGNGSRNPLAIKFGSFLLTMTSTQDDR
jgi:hypothetical protein